MSGHGMHVHGPHDHAVEHEAQGSHGDGGHGTGHGAGLAQSVAIFTAILATIGAIVGYLAGHTQNEALLFKNEAVLQKAAASDQWAYYQAKGIKQNLAEIAEKATAAPDLKSKYAEEAQRYKTEKAAIEKEAKHHDELSAEAEKKSAEAMHPHEKLAISMTFIQIAIALAAICVLTRRRWMFGLSAVAASIGLVYFVLAYLVTGAAH